MLYGREIYSYVAILLPFIYLPTVGVVDGIVLHRQIVKNYSWCVFFPITTALWYT